jgi:assimilatory nitrate reductase electron transfer subunit
VVIAGFGMVGARLAEEIRRRDGRRIRVTVVGAEPHPAYNRILLSSLLSGGFDESRVITHDAGWAFRHRVDLRLGVRVEGVDPDARKVELSDGSVLSYDDLVLATGSVPRLPPVEGLAGGDGVSVFRDLDDCRRIGSLTDATVAVLGGGVLGIEVACALAARGVRVTVVHPASVPMDRQLDIGGGSVVASMLGRLGVELCLGRRAAQWRPGYGLLLDNGDMLSADALVVTAGVVPATGLARAAGVEVNLGVIVDDQLGTSRPGIYAIGDCAEFGGAVPGLVQPGWDQAAVLADVLTGADPDARYVGTPSVTRLKAHGIDLVSLGSFTGGEELAFSDARRGRYARLSLEGDMVVGAAILGLPDAGAAITQHFVRGTPAPSDRLGFLLGRALPPEGVSSGAPSRLPAGAEICRCNRVTKRQLVHAWQAGAHTVERLAATTRATTGCGSCLDAVEGICSWLAASDSPAASARETELAG